MHNKKNMSAEEKRAICKKYKLNDYSLSYLGCSTDCPFMCPEPCMCMLNETDDKEIIKPTKFLYCWIDSIRLLNSDEVKSFSNLPLEIIITANCTDELKNTILMGFSVIVNSEEDSFIRIYKDEKYESFYDLEHKSFNDVKWDAYFIDSLNLKLITKKYQEVKETK